MGLGRMGGHDGEVEQLVEQRLELVRRDAGLPQQQGLPILSLQQR